MQYQCDSTTRPTRPSRLSESSVAYDLTNPSNSCHGDDDQLGGGGSLSSATRSNSDAASFRGVWRAARRRRSDTETCISLCVRDGGQYVTDSQRVDSMDASSSLVGGPQQQQQVLADCSLASPYDITDQATPTPQSVALSTADSSANDARSPLQSYQQQQIYLSPGAVAGATTDQQQLQFSAVSTELVDARNVEMTVSFMWRFQRSVGIV